MAATTQKAKKAQKATKTKKPAKAAGPTRVEKTTEFSEKVLKQVKTSQQSAIEAVRHFMESVDDAMPMHGENPSKRQEVIDSALEMSEKLVQTQYDFLTNVVHSAGDALGASSRSRRS